MNTKLMLQGKPLVVDPGMQRGEGGEARIYLVSPHIAAKLYKLENDPCFDLDPNPKLARERVKKKLQELQRKLPAMPKSLPERIITPQEFVTDPKSKQIVGYTMRFLGGSQLLASYADPAFARGGAYNQTVFEAFLDLHKTVRLTHAERVVFGDFNYFNILLLGSEAYVIDADSMQMPPDFWCHMYTQRFVDPRLCEWDDVVRLNLVRPHDELSDHYAYTAMLMECLLGVGPYDGIHRPKDKSLRFWNQSAHYIR
jgi:hypothetical protein